jgi:two-component system OmpR family response regulator
VAEDDTLLREILHESLEAEGFQIVSVSDGAQALERVSSAGPFDALLLDEEMPHIKGSELLERLRGEGENVAALLVSGNLDLDKQACARLGIQGVLRKPFSLSDIAGALRRAIGI